MADYRSRRSAKVFVARHLVAISVVIMFAIAAAVAYMVVVGQNIPEIVMPIIPDLSTYGYAEAKVGAGLDNGEGVVTLTAGCRQIVAQVEPSQAESIYNGINGILSARPNAHEIAIDAFQTFGVKVLMVKVTDLRNQTFYGKIILQQGNTIASLDARPSDATAIAVRTDAPVYVKTQLLEENGEKIC